VFETQFSLHPIAIEQPASKQFTRGKRARTGSNVSKGFSGYITTRAVKGDPTAMDVRARVIRLSSDKRGAPCAPGLQLPHGRAIARWIDGCHSFERREIAGLGSQLQDHPSKDFVWRREQQLLSTPRTTSRVRHMSEPAHRCRAVFFRARRAARAISRKDPGPTRSRVSVHA
jgi:hypothetical protein